MKERERRRPESLHGNAGLTPGKGGERKEGWCGGISHHSADLKQLQARLMGAPSRTPVCSGVSGKKTPQTR